MWLSIALFLLLVIVEILKLFKNQSWGKKNQSFKSEQSLKKQNKTEQKKKEEQEEWKADNVKEKIVYPVHCWYVISSNSHKCYVVSRWSHS